MKRRDEVSVGVVVTIAIIILILGTLWLARGGLKSGYPLHTRFLWGQNLKQGQPVLLAGVSIGYVGDVALQRDGHLDVLLRIDDGYTVPKGSVATVKPIGIFGDVAVALTPPIPVPAASYAPGDNVPPGAAPADVGQIMSRVDSIGMSIQLLSQALQTEVIQAGTLRDFHKTINSAAQFSGQLSRIADEQNKNLTATLATFRATAARFGTIADSGDIAASLANLKQTSANAAKLAASIDSTNLRINSLLAGVERGEGTLGKFMKDTLLYSDFRRLLARSDSLMADFMAHPRKYINLTIF